MNWGLRRQFLYALFVLLLLGLIMVAAWFRYFYAAPSCFDAKLNGGESGIDCGGPCSKLCEAPRVVALWARSVEVAPGVYHAVAMVQNPLTDAGTLTLPYKFSLYDASNILIAERTGTMFLNPGEIAPLFEPDIVTGSRVPVRTLIDFGNAIWNTMERPQNPIRTVSQALDTDNLRLTAQIENTSALPVPDATVTALLYDADGTVVAASQTKVTDLAGHTQKSLIFTWQEPFTAPIVKTDITARITP